MTSKNVAITIWAILSAGYGAYVFYLGYTNTVDPEWTKWTTPIALLTWIVMAACGLYETKRRNRT